MAAAQIYVRRKRNPETTVQNSIIWDENLTHMARFTLIAILSLPENWDYSVRGMAAMLSVSKDTMGKYLRELETVGYLLRKQGTEKGAFSKSVYIITDTPGDFGEEEPPCPKNSDSICPKNSDGACPNFSDPKKSPQQYVEILDNNITPYNPPKGGGMTSASKPKQRPKTEPTYRPDWFDRFWALYPRRTNRVAAVRAWDKLRPDLDLCWTITMALRAQMQTPQWREGPNHIPHPSTWLNGARWLDEVGPADKPQETEVVPNGWR